MSCMTYSNGAKASPNIDPAAESVENTQVCGGSRMMTSPERVAAETSRALQSLESEEKAAAEAAATQGRAAELQPAAPVLEESPRERLKRYRTEMAGRVWIPEIWGQEKLLKEWIDCTAFDRPLMTNGLVTAREALAAKYRRPNSSPLRVHDGCS